MLRQLFVSGFKSFTNFEFTIQPGLNVLVGPNGSGKTNLIRLFDFISYLHRYSLSEAVSKAGGAGEVFTKTGSATIERDIKITIRGHGPLIDYIDTGPGDAPIERYLVYESEFLIQFSADDNQLFYDNQRLSARIYERKPRNVVFRKSTWDFIITYISIGANFSIETRPGYKPTARFTRYIARYKEINSDGKVFEEYLLSSFLTRYLDLFDTISEDVSSGQTYNIVPSHVRAPEDIAQTPIINPDGSGLAATLYRLQATYGSRFGSVYGPYRRRPPVPDGSFEKVKSFFLLVNPNITDIGIKNDPYENKLKVFALVRMADREIEMPLNYLSDGTIKWLALVTAIVTSSSYFAIEEPENYIHPKMQNEFAQIVRSACEQQDRFALVTTHSETLLNAVRPNEIIIVSMEEGTTKAKRVSDPELISREINRTGFGLGYYYITEAINDA